MTQTRTKTKSTPWIVTFPQENMIIRRPSLKRICQDNADLAELLGYFLYEASKDTAYQGIDPESVCVVTLYRTQEQVLYGIDYGTARKALAHNISKLEQLGLLRAVPQQHAYIVFVENIRHALARHSQERKKPLAKVSLPPTTIHVRGQSCKDCIQPCTAAIGVEIQNDGVNVPMNCINVPGGGVNVPGGGVNVPMNCINIPHQMGDMIQFDITTKSASQAASMVYEVVGRYNRYNEDIKRDSNREDSGEADAITTAPSLFSSVHQSSSSSSSQQRDEQPAPYKGNVPKKHNRREDIKNVEDVKGGIEKPELGMLPTVEAFLALADHYRGYRLAHSNKQNSHYRLALEAATTFVRLKKTLAEVDAVFAYMKGVDERFCDDWWPMQTIDLWHVMRHFDSMSRKMAQRRAYSPVAQENAQAGRGFPMYRTVEVMEMPLEERKLYLARQREQMQQQIAQ